MTDELLNAFDECLNAITAGEAVEVVLARYPAWAAELRPMLEAAASAHTLAAEVSVPRPTQNASRAQFLARAAELRAPAPRPAFWAMLKINPRMWVNALGLFVAFVLGTYSIAVVSADSLPGEALYGVKRTVEQTELFFTRDAMARRQLEQQLAERRVAEAQQVLAAGRVAVVDVSGVLETITGNQWTVEGLTIIVPPETPVTGLPVTGLFVDVQGQTQPSGVILALSARVTGLIFRGQITALGAEIWQVGAYPVMVNAHTQLSGALGLDSEVEVVARQLADGTWLALRITLIVPTATPTSITPLPTVVASGTPSAPPGTSVPGITSTLVISTTPLPLTTPRPTSTPRASPSVMPEASPSISPEASPSAATPSRTPTGNPIGSSTPTPPLPTLTPPPSETVAPTETADPPEVEFEGLVTDVNGGLWTIGGRTVQVTGETEYEGNPGLGSYVDVNAWQYPDGTLVARRIRVR